ncbi:DUF3800 domain-containing protein [Pontivivens nitratireducens]|uniref:DUF3800 domain-containing protein n=1 Tax=Pontivivens nitratireducens TaxID=2758038 RepID=UPI00163A9B0E|nr:DUF3800 domain-containing protein [Pontibrevibacter nitratireducens]
MKAVMPPKVSFFGDASSKNSDFMVLGGLAVSGHRQQEIEDYIADIRERGGIRREFHWKEYRGGAKRVPYEELIEYVFDLVHKNYAELFVISCDFREFDHKREPEQTRDTSVNKIYWSLFEYRLAAFYGKKREIHIRLDAGNDCKDICNMRNQLCAKAYRKHGAMPNCFRTIEPMDSKASGLIQAADLIVGGIASQLNSNRTDTEKGRLAEFIRRLSGRHDWRDETPRTARSINVWNYKEG